ncbi:hypothetical protein ASC98_10945 [Rhizobacter sp. Root1238]|nr:hypothetical protein ASC98_10945 [Rhizobacter sp. Root1238]
MNEGLRIVQSKSYAGLAFDELAERVGIRKASIYHHFADKETFGVEILNATCEEIGNFFDSQAEPTARGRLVAYVESMGAVIGAGERLCPGLAMTANWGALPTRVRSGLERLAEVHLQGIRRIFERGIADGSLLSSADSELRAQMLVSAVQGALMLARTKSDAKVYKNVMDHLIASL